MSSGPYVTAAFACEQLIEGKDGVLSAIRIIDTVTMAEIPAKKLEAQAAASPQSISRLSLGPPLVNFTFLVTVKSGDFRGRGRVKVSLATPSGKSMTEREFEVDFFGDEKGQNLVLQGGFFPPEQGVYWFEVKFDDRLLTRSPLAVRIVASDSQTKTNDPEGANQESKQ